MNHIHIVEKNLFVRLSHLLDTYFHLGTVFIATSIIFFQDNPNKWIYTLMMFAYLFYDPFVYRIYILDVEKIEDRIKISYLKWFKKHEIEVKIENLDFVEEYKYKLKMNCLTIKFNGKKISQTTYGEWNKEKFDQFKKIIKTSSNIRYMAYFALLSYFCL